MQVRDRADVPELGPLSRHGARPRTEYPAAVPDARAVGVTWTEIGIGLGVSHRAAIKRYG